MDETCYLTLTWAVAGPRHMLFLFDIDGTLITTGGAGAKAWGLAFAELYHGHNERCPVDGL